jgi:hypothetical protein
MASNRTVGARLASAFRIMREVSDLPTERVRYLADSALIPTPSRERAILRNVADQREAREADRSGRPYVARPARREAGSQRARRGR